MQKKRYNKKKKLKWKNLYVFIIFIGMAIILFLCSFKLVNWFIDSKDSNQQVEQVQQDVTIVEADDSDQTEIIEQKDIPQDNPYWDYIKMKLIDVDFTELKKVNDETKGWISVNGTNINYPFVQTSDNSYYLTHTFNKSYNKAGWVFLDYRNKLDEMDQNTILYAHGRLDKTMFGSLKNILSSGWLNNSSNYVIKLSTDYENTLWQVFSVYHIPTTSDYLRNKFLNEDDFLNFSQMLIDRSSYNFQTSLSGTDKILTLSTCYNDQEKVVLHAKLIKLEKRN